jgi:hypothetical protein
VAQFMQRQQDAMQSQLQQFCAQLAPEHQLSPPPPGEEAWEIASEDISQPDLAPSPDISGTSFLDPRPLLPETARFASMVAPPRPKGEDRLFKHNLHAQVAHPSAHDTPIERNRIQARREIQIRRDQHLADLEESSLAMSAATQAMTDADLRFTQASSSIQAENYALGTPRPHGGHGEEEESLPEDWDIDDPHIEDPDRSPFLVDSSPPEGLWPSSHLDQPDEELSPESSPSLNDSVSS